MGAKRYDDLRHAFNLIVGRKKEIRFMEIGTWKGVRATWLLKDTSSPVEYYGFDLFEDLTQEVKDKEFCGKAFPPSKAAVESRLRGTGKEIKLYKGYSDKTVPQAISEGLPVMDLIFIDGGHSVDTIRTDWENIQPLIGPETVVIFDDWYKERDDVGCKVIFDEIDEDLWEKELKSGDKDKKSGITIHLAQVKRKQGAEAEAVPG